MRFAGSDEARRPDRAEARRDSGPKRSSIDTSINWSRVLK
jgi:hypothetical protein